MNKIKIFLFLLTLGLIAKGCVDIPGDIILPEWDVNLNVPLTDRYLTVDDFIDTDEQENLSIDPVDSIYILHTKEYTQTRNLLDFIRINQAVEANNIPLPVVNDSSDVFLDFTSNVVEMDSAVFAEGIINLNFINNSNTNITYTITIPGISFNGSVLLIQVPLAPGESRTVQQNLAGYKYSQPGNQSDRNRFWIKVASRTSGTVSAGVVQFGVQISEFKFRSVTGTFTEQNLGRKTDIYEADLGSDVTDFRNKVKVSSAELLVTAEYRTAYENPFDFRVDSLNILAYSGGREIYLTDSTGNRNISFMITNGLVNIRFNEKNSNIIDIINALPETFEIGASLKILGKNASGTISDQDMTLLNIELSTRSRLALGKSTIYDTVEIKLTPSEREEIRNAKTGQLSLDVLNAIPLNGWVKAKFYDSLYNNVFTLRIDNLDSIGVTGAVVNPASGEIITPSPTIKSLSLTEEEIINLSNAFYIETSVTIETSGFNEVNPAIVTIRASDWMKVRLIGKVKYRVKDL